VPMVDCGTEASGTDMEAIVLMEYDISGHFKECQLTGNQCVRLTLQGPYWMASTKWIAAGATSGDGNWSGGLWLGIVSRRANSP
jgi:hypothetical protein